MRFLTPALLIAATSSDDIDDLRVEALATALGNWGRKASMKLDDVTGLVVGIEEGAAAQSEAEFDAVLKRLIEEYKETENGADDAVRFSDFFKYVPESEELQAQLGRELLLLKSAAAQAKRNVMQGSPKTVLVPHGLVWIPSRSGGIDVQWYAYEQTNSCHYTFYRQANDEAENAFMNKLGSMSLLSNDFDVYCLGDENGSPMSGLEVDEGSTKVRLVKTTIYSDPQVVIKCYYKNPRSFSPFRGPKIGEYEVPWNAPNSDALGLVRTVPPDLRPNADLVIAEDSFGGGIQFAYSKSKAGQLCSQFEGAKRAYMKHIMEIMPSENTDIKAFVDSVPIPH
jgi:hypothetical protein